MDEQTDEGVAQYSIRLLLNHLAHRAAGTACSAGTAGTACSAGTACRAGKDAANTQMHIPLAKYRIEDENFFYWLALNSIREYLSVNVCNY